MLNDMNKRRYEKMNMTSTLASRTFDCYSSPNSHINSKNSTLKVFELSVSPTPRITDYTNNLKYLFDKALNRTSIIVEEFRSPKDASFSF